MYIENINEPKDVKELSIPQLEVMADEKRQALL